MQTRAADERPPSDGRCRRREEDGPRWGGGSFRSAARADGTNASERVAGMGSRRMESRRPMEVRRYRP